MKITIKDIAHKAGVSITTVSLVLNNKPNSISERTKEKIRTIAKELGYTPSVIAQTLRKTKSNIIGLIVPTLSNPFFSELASQIRNKFQNNNFFIFTSETFYNSDNDRELFQILLDFKVAGVIYVKSGVMDPIKEINTISFFKSVNIPCVCIDSESSSSEIISVNIDNIYGGYIATEYLISLGHKKIGCLSGPNNVLTSQQRLIGYKNCLTNFNISESFIFEGTFSVDNSESALSFFIENQCSAIFASNDLMAAGLYKAAKKFNYSIPDDLSIIGYDNIKLAEIISPELTTINQPLTLLVNHIFEAIMFSIDNINYSNNINLKPNLIIRDSCKKI